MIRVFCDSRAFASPRWPVVSRRSEIVEGRPLPWKESIQGSIICEPRLFIAGHALSQTGGHGDRRQQHDPNECCAGHVNGIIQHLQFSDEEIRAIVAVAKNAGTYVTFHAYTPQAIQQAVKQGVKGIEHGNLIDETTANMMKQNGVFLTPTLVTYATMAAPQFSGFLPFVSAKKNREVLDDGLRALELVNKIGVDICFGTDLLGPLHYAPSKEFAIRSTIQTPSEILRSATTTPARMLRQDKFLGEVAPGFAVDLLVLNANPLDDITVFDRPDQYLLATIKEGRVLSSRWSLLDVEASHLPKIE